MTVGRFHGQRIQGVGCAGFDVERYADRWRCTRPGRCGEAAARCGLRARVAAVLVLVAGCGSSSTSAPGTATPSDTTVPTTAAPATTAAAAPAACTTMMAPTVTGSGPADTTSAGSAVATDYQKFFDPTTPAATKLGLLQNGTALEGVLQSFASNKLAIAATVTDTAVDFTSAIAANVTYNLCESGAAVLPGSAGKSVLWAVLGRSPMPRSAAWSS
jgi:hypothetical protein